MRNIFDIVKYFSKNIQNELNKINDFTGIEEIRIRNSNPVILMFNEYEKILDYTVKIEDTLETFNNICENSIYAYQKEICNGYVTITGGHRVGITGSGVTENDKLININYISSLNFRISRQILNCSFEILTHILDTKENNIYNTLIVSPPGSGKTTILRDIVKNLSDGIDEFNFKGINIGVVDERGELSAMHKGISQNNLGKRTDILNNVSKPIGMRMIIRSMAPQVIVADEIGNIEDSYSIEYAECSGVKGIFTAHGSSMQDLELNPALNILFEKKIFERIIFLKGSGKRGKIDRIYQLDKLRKEYVLKKVLNLGQVE